MLCLTAQLRDELPPPPSNNDFLSFFPLYLNFHFSMRFLHLFLLFVFRSESDFVLTQCRPSCPCPPMPNPSPSSCCPLPPMSPSPPRPCCPSASLPFPQSQMTSSCCVPSASSSPFSTAFPSYASQPFGGSSQQSMASPIPSYQIGMPSEYLRTVPLPVPIPTKEKFSVREMEKQKSEEAVKDPFEKEAKASKDEPLLSSKYATAPVSNGVLPPIIYPTSAAVRQPFVPQQQQNPSSYNLQPPFLQQQQFQQPQQQQDRFPFPSQSFNPCQCPFNQQQQSPFRPFSSQSFAGQQIPLQNCCIGCSSSQRQCWTRRKAQVFGLSTLLSKGTEWEEEKQKQIGQSGEGKGEGDQCNDTKLRKIMEQNSHLTMAAAKKDILTQATDESDFGAWGAGVFCAPKDLEFSIRTEQFCTIEVADGVCFAFRTKNE